MVHQFKCYITKQMISGTEYRIYLFFNTNFTYAWIKLICYLYLTFIDEVVNETVDDVEADPEYNVLADENAEKGER